MRTTKAANMEIIRTFFDRYRSERCNRSALVCNKTWRSPRHGLNVQRMIVNTARDAWKTWRPLRKPTENSNLTNLWNRAGAHCGRTSFAQSCQNQIHESRSIQRTNNQPMLKYAKEQWNPLKIAKKENNWQRHRWVHKNGTAAKISIFAKVHVP